MANSKFKATAELFLDTSNAKNDAKKFVTDLKQQLNSIETAADKMNVFKELVGYIGQVDNALTALRTKNGDAFKHMFDGVDENFRKQFEDLFELSGDNLQRLDVLREKLATLTPKSGIAEIRKFATELNKLFTSIGADAPLNIDEFKNKATQGQIDNITSALGNFEDKWVEIVSRLKDGFNTWGMGTGGLSESVQKEIEKLQGQISELKSLKTELNSILQAKKDYDKFKPVNLEFDLSNVEEQAKDLIRQYKELDSISGTLQKSTQKYYNNLIQKTKIGLQLSIAQDSGGLDRELSEGIKRIIDSDSFRNALYEFESEFKNISAIYDQTIKDIQQQIQDIKTKAFSGGGQGEARQLLKTYDELLKIVDKLSAFSLDEIDFDDEKVVNLIKTLKDLYATEEQFADVDSIVQSIFNAEIDSPEGLERLKTLFGIEIPDSIQTAEEKYQSFKDRIESEGFTDELSAGQYLSEMESLRNELQSLYEQGRITRDQFDEIDEAFNENVKGQVDAFKNKLNVLKELNDLNKQASQTEEKEALEYIIQKRREILDTAKQNNILLEDQLAEENAITDVIEKRIGAKKQEEDHGDEITEKETDDESSDAKQENEEYKKLLETIKLVKEAVEAKTNAFKTEQSTVDSVVTQEIASLERLKEYLELLKTTAQSIFSGNKKKIGFHYGNLDHYVQTGDKSENFKYQGDSLRTGNWSSFGTGIYYLSDPSAFVGSSNVPQGQLENNQKFYAMDLSKYNLYMAQTSEQAESLYNFLNKLQKFVMSASNYRGFDKELQGVNVESLYKEFQTVFKNVSLPIEALQNFIDRMRNTVAGLDIDKDWGTFENIDEVLGRSDNIPTRFMKSLGYQGIDVSGTNWDKLQHGNVVYDLDQANAYYKTFDSLDELLEFYNQNLTQTNSIQDTINNSVAQWQKNLDAILTTVNSISTSARDSSSVMQSMADEMSKITTDAKTLETIPDIIGNLSSSLDPLVNSLHQMVNDAQSIRDALNGINGGFDQQTTSAFNVKFDDGLIASISNNIDSILDVVGDIANKIDANDSKKALVEAMKSNLTQIFKYVSDFNNKKNANMDYQKQELSMSVLSDGSISTNFGEKGRVPWDRVATSLISNLSKTLLMDIHSHPLETFINGDRHTSDSFSGANGDIGAMNFSKKLGSQLFSMITGNVMRVIDISKLTSQELNNLKIALADVEKEYAAMPEYSRYVSYDNDTGVQGYFMQDNLSEQHMVSDIFEKELYEAFSRIGYSKDFVDDKLFQKYNLTDDEQLTALAKRLVDLELAATSTLSPVERLSQIISQFGGDVTSDNAKTLLKGFEKGEVDAVDAFNQLNGWNYKTSQDAINSLLTIDSAKEMTTTESLLAQIVGVLEGIKSNITNIENNTRLDTSRQLDQAINDLAGIRQYALDNSIMYGYDGIDERMISNIDSGINIHNISSYNADEVYELAKQKKEDFSYFMHDLSSYSSNTDIMRMLERFKDTWKTINDALKVVELNNTRTGNDMIDPDTGVVARSELLDMREELINPVNISKLIDSLVKLKDATSTENRELQSAENIRSQDTSLQEIQNILNQIYGVLQGFTGIKAKDQDSVEVKKPVDESRLNQEKFSEQDLSVLGSILDAVNGINNYLTSNKYNSAPEGIGSGSDYALEATLQSVKSILESILNRMDVSEEQQIKPDAAVSEGSDNIIPDEQDGSGYALETTLQSVVTILNNILTGISINDELSAFTQPLSDAVVALKNVADGIIQHQKAQKSDTRVAQARIEDPAQQDVIRQKAIDTGLKLGSDVQIATLDSLTNGLVRVSGAFKNADGEWEGFTVKVNEANEAVDLAINKQSAFAKSLNKTSEQMADDSNPYIYSKDEVEARAQKHLNEYAAQGKNATVQFKDSGRYTITILEEIDGLSKQIFQTFDENDDKIERTTVTMSNSQKMKLDALQKKLIDNGLSSGLISDKDQIYVDYQKASDELNNMTDAYSKLDDISDDQISKWKQQIALVQQLGSQLTDLINQKKLESDKKIFESDRSKKLSKFDLDRTKLYKDISVPDSFKGQINDSRKAIETAADSDALKVAINNWEALKNKINEVAVQQDLYVKKTKDTPDSFSKDLSAQGISFDKYKKSIEGTLGITDELKTKIQALETELKSVNDSAGLSEWQKKFADLQNEIGNTQWRAKRDKTEQSKRVEGELNSKLKEAGLNRQIENPNVDQQEILDKRDELLRQLAEYNMKVGSGQQAEISGIEQTKTALFGLIDAYKQKNNIVNANGNPSKQAYGTAQLLNQGAKYNSLVSRAQGVDLTGDFDAVKKLTDAYDKLKEAQSKFKIGEDLTTESGKAKVEAFKQAQIEFNRYAQELGKVVKEEEKLVSNSTNDGTPVAEDFQNTVQGRKKALEDLVNSIPEAAIGKFNSDFTELTYTVKNGDGTFTTFTATLNAAGTTIYATAGETEKATTAFGRFFDELKNKAKGIATYLISMTGFQEIFQQIRQGIQYVIEIDSALTELKKVTDETDSTYDSFLQNMSKTASVVGSTVSELTTMAAEWARLGYSIEDSAKLAESTAILLNVSEFDNATEASKALISTMQAFSYTADKSQHVVDILNEVGNNYAVSSDGLATALQDSASALMEGGNNLEQSVALIAAANKVVQDPNSVGSALRTISLRLRGTSVDVLEEMGEETDGVITSVSKLQSKIKALSGVNILTESGDYKDTYTILKEIGQVWEDMNDIDQAALLELMAGKNRANTLSAILGNMGDLTSAYETAMNAEGSALRENATYMDSIQGRIDQFNNAVQTMWMNFIDSDVIKFIVNVGTALVKLVDKIGVLQSALTVFLTYKSIFSKKKIDFASILGIHDKKDGFVFGKQGLSKSIVNLVGNIKNKLSGIKIGDNIGGDIADNILNTDDVAVSAEEFASAIKNNIENYATINTSEIDSKIDDIQNKLATAREQLNNAKAADWDYYKSMGSVTPAEDRDTRIQEKTQEVKELETQLTNLQEQRNSMMSSVANDTAGSILEQVDEEREGYESIFSVLSEIKDVKLSIGDEQDAAKKIDEITEAAKNGQSALANYMQGLDDSDVALKAYVASVDDGNYSLTGFQQFIQQHNAGLQQSTFNAYASAAAHAALNAALSMGLSLLISFVVSGISKLINAEKEAAEAAKEATKDAEKLNEEFSSLDDYKKQIKELRKSLDSNNLSQSEAYDARQKLLTIQDELISKFGLEKEGINLVTGAIEDQIGAIDELEKKDAQDWVYSNQKAINDAVKYFDDEDKFGRGFLDFGVAFRNWGVTEDVYNKVAKYINSREHMSQRGRSEGEHDIYFEGSAEEVKSEVEAFEKWLDAYEDELRDELKVEQSESRREKLEKDISQLEDYREDLSTFKNDNFGEDSTYATNKALIAEAQEKTAIAKYTDQYMEILQIQDDFLEAQTKGDKNGMRDALDAYHAATAAAKEDATESYMDEFFDGLDGKFATEEFELNLTADDSKLKKNIQSVINDSGLFKLDNNQIKDMVSKGLNVEGAIDESNTYTDDQIQGLIKLQSEADNAGISIETLISILTNFGLINGKPAEAMADNIRSVGKAYSVLSSEAEKYKDINEILGESVYDGVELSKDQYEALSELIGSEEEFIDCVDTSDGYIVKNVELTKKLIDGKKEELATETKLAKSQAQLKYHDLVRSLGDVVSSTMVFSEENDAAAESILNEIATVKKAINQYQLLEDSLLGVTNAFEDFASAQELDSQNTYGDSYVEMAQTMYDAIYKTGEVGTEAFWAAVRANVPSDIYADLAPGESQIRAIADYLNQNVFSTLTLSDESFSIDYSAIEDFIENAQDVGIFTGTDASVFGLSANFLNSLADGEDALQAFADKMGMTKTQVYAMLSEMDKYNADGIGLSMLLQLDDSTAGQITLVTNELERLYTERKALLEQGASDDVLKENEADIAAATSQLAELEKQSEQTVVEYAAIKNAMADTGKQLKYVMPEEIITRLGLDGEATVESQIQTLRDTLLTLEEPTVIDLENTKRAIEELEKVDPRIEAHVKLNDNGLYEIVDGDDYTGEVDLQHYIELKNTESFIDASLKNGLTTTESLLSEIAENTAVMAGKESGSNEPEDKQSDGSESTSTSDVDRGQETSGNDNVQETSTGVEAGHQKHEPIELPVVFDIPKALSEAYKAYKSDIDEFNKLEVSPFQTTFGNIDTNNRQILEWTNENLGLYKDALESWYTDINGTQTSTWNQIIDDLRGTSSTVFGASSNFDGVEIAFSPMLQTENGAVLLDKQTVDEYIYGLIDKAGEGWTKEDLLSLDTEGLEVDGQKIKGLIADVGDTAIQTGEAMHYVGADGSIAQNFKVIEDAAKEAGISVEDMMYRLRNTEGPTMIFPEEIDKTIDQLIDQVSKEKTKLMDDTWGGWDQDQIDYSQDLTTSLSELVKLKDRLNNGEDPFKVLSDLYGMQGTIMLDVEVDKNSAEEAGEAAVEAATAGANKGVGITMQGGVVNPKSFESTSVKSYSQLQGDITSLNSVLSQSEEFIENNIEITQEYKDSLLELCETQDEIDELNACFDTGNKLVVKNSNGIKKLIGQKKKELATDAKLSKAQSKLEYYNLYKDLKKLTSGLGYTSDGYAILTDAQREQINSLYEEMNAARSAVAQFSLLEMQLLGTTNAYTRFQEAQNIDSENNYSSQAESMVETFANALNTGDLGTASAREAMLALVPEEVYANLDTVEEKLDAVAKYFNEGELSKYFSIDFDDDGGISGVETTTENLQQFVADGIEKGLFTGDWEHFDLSENVTSLEQFAKEMGITEEVAYAMFEALESHDAGNLFDPSNILEKFVSGNIEYQAYQNVQALADLEYQLANGTITAEEYNNKLIGLDGQLRAGKISEEEYNTAVAALKEQLEAGTIKQQEYNAAVAGLSNQHDTIVQQAYDEVTAYSEKSEALEKAKEDLEKYNEMLETGVDENGNPIDREQVQKDIEATTEEINTLVDELSKLKEPTEIVIELAMEHVQGQIDDVKEDIMQLAGDDVKVHANIETVFQEVENSGFDLSEFGLTKESDGSWTGVAEFATSMGLDPNAPGVIDTVTNYINLIDQQHTLSLMTGEEAKDTLETLSDISTVLQAIADKLGADYTLNVKTKMDTDPVTSFLNTPLSKTISVGIKKIGSWFGLADGTVHANGTANISGAAHATGSWGAPKTETALVGELGPELLVRNGRWHTVGENGAEFTDVQRGDIIFNHKQTADLLSKGYVTGRGKAFAEGTAYAGIYTYDKYRGKEKDAYKGSGISNAASKLSKAASDISKSSDKLSDDFKEIFDWIAVRIEEITNEIDVRNARLDNAVGSSKQNAIIDDIIGLNKSLYDNLTAGASKYYEYAQKLLEKVPAEYREAAQNGAIAIESFTGKVGESALEAIQDYREWVQKGDDLTQQAEETLTEISSLAKQAVDNIASDYDNKKSIKDSKIDQYEAYNSLLETDVGFESEKIYQAMMSENKSNIGILQKQRDAMLAELNKRVESGEIKKYSQDWYDVVNDISAVDTEIIELKTDIEDYQDSINELHWDKFDLLMDKLNAVSDEADNLIDVLSSKDLVNKDTAEWTDEGITTLGLYAQKMDAAEVQAKKYEEQINYLNKNWKKLGYTEQEYIDKLDELKSGQYDAIKAYNDTKDAIVNLNEERVEAIKTIIQDEIDAYTELINKKKEELDSEKDLYDFQKSVSEKQKDIAKIQRQLAALAGDNSASARAKRAQLEAELLDAQADLEETYYDRSISNQQEALDKELESFEDAKNDEMEGWDEYLENTNKVVADSLDVVKANTNAIYQELQAMGQEYGLSITESLISPWKEGENAIQAFSEKFGLAMSATVDELKKLELEFMETMEKIEKSGSTSVDTVKNNASGYQSAEYKPPKQEGSSGGGSSSGSSSGNSGGGDSGGKSYPYGKASETSGNIKEGARGNQVKAIQYALNQLGYGNSGTKSVDGKFGSGTKSAVRAFQKAMGISADGIVGKNTRAKFRAKGYKFGTTGVDTDQFAWIDEMGLEEIVLHAQDGKLAYLTKGSAVLPHSISENLMKLGQLDPQYMLDINRPQASVSPSIINNTMELSVDNSIGTLISIENFDGNNPDEITKVVNKALEQHTKNLNNALRKFAR